MLTLLYYPKL